MVNKIILTIIAVLILSTSYFSFKKNKSPVLPAVISPTKTSGNPQTTDYPQTTVIAQNLDTPWSLVFLPDKSILVTERPGRVRHIRADGSLEREPVITLDRVTEVGEGGLLGIALHPDFPKNHYIYLYYTYKSTDGSILNRVVRMTYQNNTLKNEKTIIDSIPGQSNHNGGRIKFGPDKNLYIGTGDAQNSSSAQDKDSLSGKILRVTDEGGQAIGNPFDNLTYSYGHRNVQGLAWDGKGQLYATEHGRSGFQSGLDEFNKINVGSNYGWPVIEGDKTKPGMEKPLINSGPLTTWAPSGLAYRDGVFYFGGLRGSALYKVTLNGSPKITEYLKGQFGRIRDVVLGPDNMLYITTSNMDGRGIPQPGDDKIIRINPEKL